MNKFKQWVESVTANASVRELARHTDYSPATVSRHINAGSVQFCIDLAQAYDTNPIPGLLAAGAITEHQIDEYSRSHDLSDYTDLELAQEIVSRLENAASRETLTTPTDELASRRTDGGTRSGVEDYGMPELAVADSSPFHEEENTEFDD